MAIAHEIHNITDTAHSLYHLIDYGILISVLCVSFLLIKKVYMKGN